MLASTPNTPNREAQRPRCPQPPKSSYLRNITITSVNFHSSKDPSPEVQTIRKSHDNPTGFAHLKVDSRINFKP